MRKIEVIIEKTGTGYSAYADKSPAITTGENLKELTANMVEALNLYFEDKGRTVTQDDLKFRYDLASLFGFYQVINSRALSRRIGMNPQLLSQYVSGVKKPSVRQVKRILEGVRQIGRELSQLDIAL